MSDRRRIDAWIEGDPDVDDDAPPPEEYVCPACDAIYPTQQRMLDHHTQAHQGARPAGPGAG